MLHAAMVLEDLLSDLRYLDPPPDLADNHLRQLLLEAGELLSSSIEITAVGREAIAQVQLTVQRLQAIHDQVKQRYIPDWSELKQVHKEFAEEGFDLVVLALEMALGDIPVRGPVPMQAMETAQQTIEQLAQIGQDLQFEAGWTALLQECAEVKISDSAQWHQAWPNLFARLKNAAKQGGVEAPAASPIVESDSGQAADLQADSVFAMLQDRLEQSSGPISGEFLSFETFGDLDLDDNWDMDALELLPQKRAMEATAAVPFSIGPDLTNDLEKIEDESLVPEPTLADLEALRAFENSVFENGPFEDDVFEALDLDGPFSESSSFETDFGDFAFESFSDFGDQDLDLDDLNDLGDFNALELLDSVDQTVDQTSEFEETGTAMNPEFAGIELESSAEKGLFPIHSGTVQRTVAPQAESSSKRNVQIPVSLERLDQSAQQVIKTLLSTRAAMNSSQKLQDQIAQITALT